MKISIDKIRMDGGTQPRAALCDETIAEYAERMEAGDSFPPVVVFHDGKDYWLADGFHRVNAAIRFGAWKSIDAEVKQGNQRDAILYSVGANGSHGKPRTNADKRRAVQRLLDDAEWARWSDRKIAETCAVSHNFVGEVRKSLSSDYSEPRQYVTKHGTTATMDTTNIGKSRTAYKCRVCLDDFDRGDLWHCPVCSHHYRINSGTCSNCHKAEAASSTDMIATGKTIAETIRGYEKSGKDKAIEVVDRATGEVIENAEIVTTKRERAAAQETFASDAMTFAAMAISQLERIRTGDPKRTEALESVAEWISENL